MASFYRRSYPFPFIDVEVLMSDTFMDPLSLGSIDTTFFNDSHSLEKASRSYS
jgi:hypothetical protein